MLWCSSVPTSASDGVEVRLRQLYAARLRWLKTGNINAISKTVSPNAKLLDGLGKPAGGRKEFLDLMQLESTTIPKGAANGDSAGFTILSYNQNGSRLTVRVRTLYALHAVRAGWKVAKTSGENVFDEVWSIGRNPWKLIGRQDVSSRIVREYVGDPTKLVFGMKNWRK